MLVKYMGLSHVHRLDAGDDFGGRLKKPLANDVVFDESNRWVIDTDAAGLSKSAVEVLLTDPDFLDVSDLELIPVNEHQKVFKAMSDVDALEEDFSGDDGSYTVPETASNDQPPQPEAEETKKKK